MLKFSVELIDIVQPNFVHGINFAIIPISFGLILLVCLQVFAAIFNDGLSFFLEFFLFNNFLDFIDFSKDIVDCLFIGERNIFHKVIEHISEVGNLNEVEGVDSGSEDLNESEEVLRVLDEFDVHHVSDASLIVQLPNQIVIALNSGGYPVNKCAHSLQFSLSKLLIDSEVVAGRLVVK